jgi:uncharacterized membrane protein
VDMSCLLGINILPIKGEECYLRSNNIDIRFTIKIFLWCKTNMYPSNNRPSTKWLLLPILIAVGIIALVVGTGIYFRSSTAGFYWFPFPFFPLVFIPIAILVFFAFRWSFWGCWGGAPGWNYGQYYDPAMVTLRERYAKGEITKEQLEQMTKDLEQGAR